ncbi:hypothetical protein RND71_017199 [Anisodus tanguticus]|uniref:NPH3 domain-containing protein n=1 Tax=Anisodus tanguticus TaxID=243964 RepID=A0AAE1V9T2_9SOLA|nr:hypothetical protein RND71_017199 [Anisodus tanguticus]
MKKLTLTESINNPSKSMHFSAECWFDDTCILDMDYFVKTLSGIKAKGPEVLIGPKAFEDSPESVTAVWMKKRFFVETLVGILPPEKDSIPCNFLLRLLRVANMVRVEPTYRADLEKRISWQLDQATLKELMIPSFVHTCGTLLDVELVLRLVKRFMSLDEGVRSGAALIKVAKLVDNYLAEAAVDGNLTLSEFIGLASALPGHARSTDDALYRAIDTYLKAHPGVTKQERKSLCRLIDSRKLSPEASLHATQNERLPVRAVIQVLLSEQTKLNNKQRIDWSGSFVSGTRSPNNQGLIEPPARCMSKREMNVQQIEIKRLKEDVLRLQSRCMAMQAQIDKLLEKKRGSGFFSWKKIIVPSLVNQADKFGEIDRETDVGFIGRQTPVDMKTRLVRGRTPNKWRKSLS